MPESLKVHSGERVDLVDYVEGATIYTQEAQKFEIEREWLDRRSRILDGFRVQIEDQTVNPGMITVYNGNAADRNGQLTNNEQVANDSRSITLLGSNLNFYVEIEFIQNESKTDARFFWDPTITNSAPIPDGGEFSLNVATRLAPDWRIVSPVSTTSFEQTSNPNSIRIPVGVFRTDGSNRVAAGASNPGLSLVTAASVLEVDSAIGQSQIRVVDCRIFPATLPFNVTVDLGGTAPEARTVSSIDRANGLLTLSVALASTHRAGAIVRVTSGSAMLVKERTDPSDPALDSLLSTPGHPDPAQRFWQANETRGSALTTSKETFGSRDDLGIRSLKDQIDALSAQLRELKFGHPRPDVVSAAPPLSFGARPRWFDQAGSVTGARTNSVSIGNGTTSFGDFNVTGYSDASAMLTAAVAALPASGGTIYVKAGTYSLPTTVTIAKSVTFIGENYANTIFSSTNAGGAAISTTGTLRFVNMTYQRGGGAAANTLDITAAINVQFDYSIFIGQIRLVGVNAGVIGTNSSFVQSGVASIIIGSTIASTLTNSRFDKCLISTAGFFITSSVNDVVMSQCYGSALSIYALTDGSVTRLVIRDCQMTITSAVAVGAAVTGAVNGVSAYNNRFTIPAMTPNSYVFGFWNTADVTNRVRIHDNYFNFTGGTTSSGSPSVVLWLKSTQAASDIGFDGNMIDCNVGSFICGAQLDQGSITKCSFSNNYCNRTYDMLRIGGPVGGMTSCFINVHGNVFDNKSEHDNIYGVRLLSDPGINHLSIRDNVFKNLGSGSVVGTRIAIEISTAFGGYSGAKYDISGNFCVGITGGNDESHFVRFKPTAGAQISMNIENNLAESIASPTVATAVYIAATGFNQLQNVKIRGNRFDTITAPTAYGVFVANQNANGTKAPSIHIQDNDIYTILGTTVATGIEMQNVSQTICSGNTVTGVECIFGTAPQNGCCIRYANSTTSARDIHITNNYCDQSINTDPTAALDCIVLYLNAVTLTNFRVDDNVCRGASVGSFLVWLSGTSTSGWINGSVSDNVIEFRSTSITDAMSIALGAASLNVKVNGNVIQETTYGASINRHKGISFTSAGPGPRAVSCCNNVLTGVKSGAALTPNIARIGISISGPINETVVNNNLIDWNAAGVVIGRGIVYADPTGSTSDHHLIVGNLVTGDNDVTIGGELDFDTVRFRYGYVVGNNVGTAVAPGTIVPGTPVATTWDYGAATGTGAFQGLNKVQ